MKYSGDHGISYDPARRGFVFWRRDAPDHFVPYSVLVNEEASIFERYTDWCRAQGFPPPAARVYL